MAVELKGATLWAAAIVLAMANFIAVLNMTIANVTVPNMVGSLGAGTSQGTWIITAYAVAEAITVPLTGWISARFGSVRVFVLCVLFFGVFSLMCGISTSLSMLLAMRVLQGITGGPLLALSQALLLKIFPKEKAMQATGLWAMTTLLAPVVGPVLGGWLADQYSWRWAFFINVPQALTFGAVAWLLLRRTESPTQRKPIDVIGLVLLVVWVGSLQIMLDEGKDKDWFASTEIVTLAVIAIVGFLAFLIWELTEEQPIVDLRIFRHRGYSMCMVALVLSFGAFFAANVLTPLWLQYNMGYTATWAGVVVAWSGVLQVFFSPVSAKLADRVDPRFLIFTGIFWLGVVMIWRSVATTDMGFMEITIPMFCMGVGFPLYFVPLTGVAMGAVDEREMTSASGLMAFVRTIAGAFGTSLVTTAWEDNTKFEHAQLADIIGNHLPALPGIGAPIETLRSMFDMLVTNQALLLATNNVMLDIGIVFIIAAFTICGAPKPTRTVDPTSVGH
jgi:DHA2 family multidrug resistance protein